MKNSKLHTTEDKSNEKVTSSNSKSEDTQDFTPDEAVVCTKCGYGEWRHDSLKHPCNVFEPPQDSPLGQATSLKEAVKRFCRTDKAADNLVAYIQAWHKAEIAKLFEQIRSEVMQDEPVPERKDWSKIWDGKTRHYNNSGERIEARYRNKLRAEQREALTRLELGDSNGLNREVES